MKEYPAEGVTRITDSELRRLHGALGLSYLCQKKGMPMKGRFNPELHPDYIYVETEEPESGDTVFTWRRK